MSNGEISVDFIILFLKPENQVTNGHMQIWIQYLVGNR